MVQRLDDWNDADGGEFNNLFGTLFENLLNRGHDSEVHGFQVLVDYGENLNKPGFLVAIHD